LDRGKEIFEINGEMEGMSKKDSRGVLSGGRSRVAGGARQMKLHSVE